MGLYPSLSDSESCKLLAFEIYLKDSTETTPELSRLNIKRFTCNCKHEGADWEDDFPIFTLQLEDNLQNCRNDADSSTDEEISQHIKLRHDHKNQDGGAKRHQTLDDKDLEKTKIQLIFNCQGSD